MHDDEEDYGESDGVIATPPVVAAMALPMAANATILRLRESCRHAKRLLCRTVVEIIAHRASVDTVGMYHFQVLIAACQQVHWYCYRREILANWYLTIDSSLL